MRGSKHIVGLPIEAAPGLRSAVQFTVVLSAGMLAGWATPAHAIEILTAIRGTTGAAPSYLLEARTCAPCHSSLVQDFGQNPHAGPAAMHDKISITCESCHGSKRAHVTNSGGSSSVLDPALAIGRQLNALCLGCHAGKNATFQQSAHGRNNVSCTSCHRIHASRDPKHQLMDDQLALCFQCHASVKPQFAMPSHHDVKEGLIQCTDCHDPHGTVREELHVSSGRQDTFCTNCHARITGPFVYDHAVMKTEGCTACHFPHGGPNPNLLLRANVDAVCRQCHFPAQDTRTEAHLESTSRSCIDCHVDVHGSNTNRTFLRVRSVDKDH